MADRILKNDATTMLFVKMITMFDIANTVKMKMKVFLRSYFENSTGMNRPAIAIVNVNELTYNPEIAIVVLKYWEIWLIIPIMLNGVFIASAEIINMYKRSFEFFILSLITVLLISMVKTL